MNAPLIPSFYQMRDFDFVSDRKVVRDLDRNLVQCPAETPYPFENILGYFDEVSYERAGILPGEYAMLNELILIRRDGFCIKSNVAWEEGWASRAVDDYCNSPFFAEQCAKVLEMWDNWPLAESMPLISTPYPMNYYHWTFEAVTKQRFFPECDKLLLNRKNLQRTFQKDLLARVSSGKIFYFLEDHPIRVRDPMLAHDIMGEGNVDWLRHTLPFNATPGNRRIYLRRSTRGTRTGAGGGIHETPEFLDLLARHQFETVDFGEGDYTILEQVALLDKAGIILAPHGAALSNLTYLNAPLGIIELIGPRTPRAVFMHLSSMLGFRHIPHYCTTLDENGNIEPPIDAIDAAIRELAQ